MVSIRGATTVKAAVALATLLALVFTVAWYGWLEPPWLSYRNMPFEPVRPAFKPGEPVLLRVTRCNSSGETQSYLISRRLIRLDQPPEGQKAIILTPGLVDIDPGCVTEDSAASISPPDTPDGSYFIKGRAKVDGTWRSPYVDWSSQPFIIRRE